MDLPMPLKKIKDICLFNLYNIIHSHNYRHCSNLMKRYLNRYKDKRCFIIGTGPSIKKTNLNLLKDEITFGVNTLYKIFKNPTFYAVSDNNVWKKHDYMILSLDTTLFLSSGAGRDYIRNRQEYGKMESYVPLEPILLRTKGYMSVSDEFSTDASQYVVNGHSVITDVCLQVAFYMGFAEVYLVGTDFSDIGTRWDGSKTENIKAVGMKDADRIFYCLERCKKVFEENNRKIFNATKGGKLEVFDRVKLEDVL
jgi:hypothetical protein